MIKALKVLFEIFSKYRLHIVALIVLGIVGAFLDGIGINIAIPLLSFFTGGGTPTDPVSHATSVLFGFLHIPFTFRYLLAFIVVLFFARAVSIALFYFIRSSVTANFLSTESNTMFKRLLEASWPYLLRQKIGHTQTLMIRDVQRTSALLDVITQVIQSGTGFVMYCAIALSISPYMTLMALLGAAVLLFSVRPFLRRAMIAGHEMTETEKSIAQFLSEHIIGMKIVKSSGVAQAALKKAHVLIEKLRLAQVRMALVRSISSSFFQPFSLVFVVILFFITYKMPGFSIISFAATLYLIQKIFTYAESSQSSLHGVSETLPYATQMLRFKHELASAREGIRQGSKPFVFDRALSFDHVSLSYGEIHALRDISCTISRGSTVGVIGPSGSGKTSFADLLLRLFEPQQGTLLLDQTPVQDINLEEWRDEVAYVPQEVFLFNASIAENVRLYRDIGDDDVVQALKHANIYDTVSQLPQGIDTPVGDRGVFLSGGQRQRIALARALARKPSILILDEATSALDAESESAIQDAIDKLHGSITVIIIAHRFTTIADADTILVIDKGEIVEKGSPAQLEKNPESYFVKSR